MLESKALLPLWVHLRVLCKFCIIYTPCQLPADNLVCLGLLPYVCCPTKDKVKSWKSHPTKIPFPELQPGLGFGSDLHYQVNKIKSFSGHFQRGVCCLHVSLAGPGLGLWDTMAEMVLTEPLWQGVVSSPTGWTWVCRIWPGVMSHL